MKISDLMRMGIQNLCRRKARTALTIIGVVIGTISIVVMISIGLGMNKQYEEQVMQLGSLTSIYMDSMSYSYDESGYGGSTKQVLDDKLVKKIKEIEHVESVVPMHSMNINLTYKNYMTYSTLYAVDYSQLELLGVGEYSYVSDPNGVTDKTFIMGSNVLNYMYDSVYYRPVESSKIDIKKGGFGYWLEGNYARKDEGMPKAERLRNYAMSAVSGSEISSYDCYVSMKFFKEMTERYIKQLTPVDQKKAQRAFQKYDRLVINVDNVEYVSEVQEKLSTFGFKTESLAAQLEPMKQTSTMLQMVLGGVGAVAMLVSAISIANTMIMSIYERTREIGIMKVLGCTVSDIRKMFLFEAGMIGLFGGIVGDLIGYLVSYLINTLGGDMFSALMNAGSMDMYGMGGAEGASQFSMIPFWLPLMAAGFAMVVGLVSGYYPAKRATKISAIEAMRTDG